MLTTNEFYTIADLLPEPCMLVADNGLIHAVNSATSELLGYGAEGSSTLKIDELSTNCNSELSDYISECKYSGEMKISKSFSLRSRLGESMETRLEGCLAHYNAKSGDSLIFIRCIDICSSQKNHTDVRDRCNDSAGFDFITTLPNNDYFKLTFKQEWNRATRHQEPLSLILVKIDQFQKYQITYGEIASNACLQSIARTINAIPKRAADYLATIDRGHFAILLPNTSLQGAIIIAEKARSATQRLNIINSTARRSIVTMSAGVATLIPNADKQVNDLFEEAEIALEKAQEQGFDRVQIPAGSLVSYSSFKSKQRKAV